MFTLFRVCHRIGTTERERGAEQSKRMGDQDRSRGVIDRCNNDIERLIGQRHENRCLMKGSSGEQQKW